MKEPSAKGNTEKRSRAVSQERSSGNRASAGLNKAAFEDLHARISWRAYELYVQRGCREGHAQDDWLDAEREICRHESPA